MKLNPLQDQAVVVFGASSGIGREMALQFAQRGARVAVGGVAGASVLLLRRRARHG